MAKSVLDLVDMDRDRLSIDDIERVLEAEKTTVNVTHDGRPFLSPSANKVRVTRPRARTSARGKTEISFKVSFVITTDDFEEEDDELSHGEMVATSDDWGLSEAAE